MAGLILCIGRRLTLVFGAGRRGGGALNETSADCHVAGRSVVVATVGSTLRAEAARHRRVIGIRLEGRTFFSVGLGAVVGLGETLVSAGFSGRGLHATVIEPIPRTANALTHNAVLRKVLPCIRLPRFLRLGQTGPQSCRRSLLRKRRMDPTIRITPLSR